MELLVDLFGLVLCLGIPIGIAAWLVFLTRRPSRPCPHCSASVALSAAHCPDCGEPLTAQDEES